MAGIKKLVINSAYRKPDRHWKRDQGSQDTRMAEGRRPAGFFIAGQGSNVYNDVGHIVELPLVNLIRGRVNSWREEGYPGITGVTSKLIEHWNDSERRQYPFFWCQLDAMETLLWLTESPSACRIGVDIPSDGSPFRRICTKLCTGGGKTAVMAMLIAWQTCNKVAYPNDARFSKNILVVAPNITIKSRLQELQPSGNGNCYDQFSVVPASLADKLYQGKVEIRNWHALAWDDAETIKSRKSVDRRGVKSDEAYARDVLGSLARARDILVINDEAHHAWRKNPGARLKGVSKEEETEATVWVNGLDRLHSARRISACYDFSATPFAPAGGKSGEESLFGWIVSDFGLNDGIESGLVKTPRIVIRDDALPSPEDQKPKIYHLYNDVKIKANVNRAAKLEDPLPKNLLSAYYMLGKDWQKTYNAWNAAGSLVPPVMITVANRTETAARIKRAFDHRTTPIGFIEELCVPELTLHIDSKVLEAAESVSFPVNDDDNDEDSDSADRRKLSKTEHAALLRDTVNTIGQPGKRGEQIRNVISVGMLSEGWDAKTVTHIMGLRAFTSQLLCEQVIGRGLRRKSYDLDEASDIFEPEYVNVFGIPYAFLPHESEDGDVPKPQKPKTQVEVLKDRREYLISWPNVISVDRVFKPELSLDKTEIEALELYVSDTPLLAELAPVVDGKAFLSMCTEIDLIKLDSRLRMQKLVFEASADVYDIMRSTCAWQKDYTAHAVIGQVINLVMNFVASGAISIIPPITEISPLRLKLLYMLNMQEIVRHLWEFIKVEQTEALVPILDSRRRTRSTADMPTWFTGRQCFPTAHSHISHVVIDSSWEATESYKLEKNPDVKAWAKNDHLGFEIFYNLDGVVRKYYPDFLVRLSNGKTLVLETKGRKSPESEAKSLALVEWINAVNELGEFGEWCCDISYNPVDVEAIILKHL
ncbi:MAG: DEAD/DEAH box helicase family protein [Deltaproteobacteria bacterium]|jgi:type III restriction enzyme|nr:DEAD/DEAH box helicase family protein [Deltaproteobacteria bacterium]